MSNTECVSPTPAGSDAVPLLYGKRRPLASDIAAQYAGTDTERDIK
jgi:hypothetical protein